MKEDKEREIDCYKKALAIYELAPDKYGFELSTIYNNMGSAYSNINDYQTACDYYEKSLKAGAGKYFDVINIHPYRGGLTSFSAVQKFIGDIQKFHDLTVQYTGADKPCWITEMGWATPPVLGRNLKAFLEGALKK